MKKPSPRDLARLFYLAAKGKDEKEAAQVARRFRQSLERRGLASLLPEVLDELPKAADEAEGREEVVVESARPLSDSAVAELLAAVGADPAKCVVASRIVPELIGGARVRRKDVVLDASVRKRLERFSKAVMVNEKAD